MVYPNGWNVRHAKGYGRSDSGVTGHDAVRPVDQNRIDEAKLLDAGCNLFDLSGRVCAWIGGAGSEFAGILIFDGQRLHDASQTRGVPSDRRDRESD